MKANRKVMTKQDEAKALLKKQLMSGLYKPGDQITSELQLAKQLGISRSTVREAIGMLVNEGYLSRVRGSGTFVADNTHRNHKIAVILGNIYSEEEPSASSALEIPLLAAINAEARRNNAAMLLYVNENNPEMERESLLDLIEQQVDGAIVMHVLGESNIDCLQKVRDADIPLVQVDRYCEELDADYVVTDNFAGAYDAVSAMVNMGIENTYFISLMDTATSTRNRMLGYTEAVHNLGVASNVILVKPTPESASADVYTNQLRCIKRSLENIALPAAIFSSNVGMNTAVCSVLADLEIPSDQLVLGYFDRQLINVKPVVCHFEIEQPIAEIGAKCVQILLDKLKGNTETQKIAIKPKLTLYDSSKFSGASVENGIVK